jgi:hypothetical protein
MNACVLIHMRYELTFLQRYLSRCLVSSSFVPVMYERIADEN